MNNRINNWKKELKSHIENIDFGSSDYEKQSKIINSIKETISNVEKTKNDINRGIPYSY